jgi:hypothetical protein
MAPPKADNAGEELQLFCNDTREYVYLGPLQDWLTFRYSKSPFPVLHALAQQGRVFQILAKKQKIGGGTGDRDRMRPAVQGGGSAGITHIEMDPGIPRVLDHGRR